MGGNWSIGGISSGERSIMDFHSSRLFNQVELLAYEYQNQNIQNSTIYFHMQTIVTWTNLPINLPL